MAKRLMRLGRAPGMDSVRGWVMAALLGGAVTAVLPGSLGWAVRVAAAWDAALLLLIAVPWRMILRSDEVSTRLRAARADPGAAGTLGVALVASVASLAAAMVLLRRPLVYASQGMSGVLAGLGIVAVIGAWAMMHTAFTLHYAHLYYIDDGSQGGLEFAGGAPDDLDFAYFAFGIGMTYQVADVTVADRGIRRAVLLHSVLSFAFNTAILALVINLVFAKL